IRYAFQTTSDPGRAYSATPADRAATRSSRFFGLWPKNTSAELLSDVSCRQLVRTGAATPGPLSLPTLHPANGLTCLTNLKLLAKPTRVLRNVSPFLRRTSKICL